MIKIKKDRILLGLLLAILFTSCAPEIVMREQHLKTPAQFHKQGKDTSNVAASHFKTVFSDSYLTALIDTALQNNQELNIFNQEIQMEQNEVLARKGAYLPFLNLQAGAGADKVGEFTRDGAVEENLHITEEQAFPKILGDFAFGANVSWEVDIWKKLRKAKKSAFLHYLASVEGKNWATTNLVAEIADAYYELLALDSQLANVEQNISILNDALEVVKLQKEAAKTTELAVQRFEAEVLKNKSSKFVILQKITETENRINFLAGRYPQPVQRDKSNFADLPLGHLTTGVPVQLLENRPDIRKAELELQAAKIDIEIARAEFLPSLDINAGLGYQAFNPKYLLQTPQSILFSLVGDLAAPVINRNAIKAEFNTATAKQIKAVYEYEQTLLRAYFEVANQLAKMENLEQSFTLKAQQVEALTQSVEISNDLFKSARADYFEVLQTQREALEAKMELIETKAEQMKAFVTMYQALGGGWR